MRNTEPNPAQKEVMDLGFLTSGFNCSFTCPPGSGKTWLAEQAIFSTLHSGRRAIYLTPLRSLANELLEPWQSTFLDLKSAYSPESTVNAIRAPSAL